MWFHVHVRVVLLPRDDLVLALQLLELRQRVNDVLLSRRLRFLASRPAAAVNASHSSRVGVPRAPTLHPHPPCGDDAPVPATQLEATVSHTNPTAQSSLAAQA